MTNKPSVDGDRGGAHYARIMADRFNFAHLRQSRLVRLLGQSATVFAAAVAAVLAINWWTSPVPLNHSASVARQWNQAISQLGIEPLYPPQEDVAVGDIFLIVTRVRDDEGFEVLDSPLARRSVKLWRQDLASDLEKLYEGSFTFPSTILDTINAGWEHEPTENIFGRNGKRKHMPLVLFPELTVEVTRSASAKSGWSLAGFVGGLAADGAGDRKLEIKIAGVETYGVPFLIASGALREFCDHPRWKFYCTEVGARTALSSLIGKLAFEKVADPQNPEVMVYRVDAEIMLVKRIYLTRSIETVDSEDRQFGAAARAEHLYEEAGRKLKNLVVEEGKARQGGAPQQSAATGESSTEDRLRRLETMLAEIAEASGTRAAAQSLDSRGLTVRQTALRRPVVIGFKGVSRILVPSPPVED